MVILFDIGNSNIKVVKAIDNKIVDTYRLKTNINLSSDELYLQIKPFLINEVIEGAIISSVVPQVTEDIIEVCEKHYNIKPLVFGQGLKTGLMIKADNPKEVGSDLIADCVGSFEYKTNCLIVDLGTATKVIYCKNQTFEGVSIIPGVSTSLKALVKGTALLPNIEINPTKKIICNNSISCMQSGITYGTACMIDGLIDRIKDEVKDDFIVIATGGIANKIIPLCKHEILIDNDLTLKGILNIYYKNNN